MSVKNMNHVDGGLINLNDVSHINVTIQALLHCSPLLELICKDEDHQHSCRSLLRCIFCSLSKIYRDMFENGLADPVALATRWNAISHRMTAEQKSSPLQVLSTFVDLLRMEYAMRDPKCLTPDIFTSPVAGMWQITTKAQVTCPSCGQFTRTSYDSVVELMSEYVSDLENSIIRKLLETKQELCLQCRQQRAKSCVLDVSLPHCLIIHVDRCAPEFHLPYNLNILENEFELSSIIVEPKGTKKNCFIVTSCPDKYMRRFEDTKISPVSPVTLYSAQFLQLSKLTMLYVKVVSKPTLSKGGQVDDKFIPLEVMSVYNSSELAPAGGTPTPTPVTSNNKIQLVIQTNQLVSKAVQTLPLYCYEICKNNPKFKFYTGLEVEDFENLFSLIGGDEAISKLKRNYRLGTPQKLRPNKLSSEDKLFLFLLRLRRGLPLQELSEMFNVSVPLVSELCYVMTRLIYLTFKAMEDDMFPTAGQQRVEKPWKMRPFKNLRIILDGVSFFIQTPSNFQQQGNTYSAYKAHTVIVFSVGISCNGATIFCSGGMEGAMSDKGVILASGLLDRLHKGDGVMTDRGYELTAELQAKGCEFFKPPTLGERDCFTQEEEILTKAIASARIYSEHAIADIKDNRLLQGVIPLTLLPVLGDLVYIAAYLRNFSSSRIHDKRFVCNNEEGEDEPAPNCGKKISVPPKDGVKDMSSSHGDDSGTAVPSVECEDLSVSDDDWPF